MIISFVIAGLSSAFQVSYKHWQHPGGGVVISPLSCNASEILSDLVMVLQWRFSETWWALQNNCFIYFALKTVSQLCNTSYNTTQLAVNSWLDGCGSVKYKSGINLYPICQLSIAEYGTMLLWHVQVYCLLWYKMLLAIPSNTNILEVMILCFNMMSLYKLFQYPQHPCLKIYTRNMSQTSFTSLLNARLILF